MGFGLVRAVGGAFQQSKGLIKLLVRQADELLQGADFGPFPLEGGLLLAGLAARFQLGNALQTGFEVLMHVARHDSHVLQNSLFVTELREGVLDLLVQLAHLGKDFVAAALRGGLLPSRVFLVHTGIQPADFSDEPAQLPQVAFAVGNFFVHHYPVESFFGRFGKELFRNGNVLFGGEAEAIDQAFDFLFGIFDALADLDFLLTG